MNILDYLFENKRKNIVVVGYDYSHCKALRDYVYEKGAKRFHYVDWSLMRNIIGIRSNFKFVGDQSYVYFVPLFAAGLDSGVCIYTRIDVLLVAEEINEDDLKVGSVMKQLLENVSPDGITGIFSRKLC